MTIYFAGNEIGCFTANDAGSYEVTDWTDATYGRCSMFSDGTNSHKATPYFTAQTEGYINFVAVQDTGAYNGTSYLFYADNSSGVHALRLYANIGAVKLQYYNGASWIDATGTAFINTLVANLFTVSFKVNSAAGYLRLYSGSGSLLLDSGTIDLSTVSNISRLLLIGGRSVFDQYHREVIVADVPTIGWRLGTLYLTGAGATNTFTAGTYAEVDEITYSTADFLSSGTADQIFLGACNDLDPGALTIKGVGVGALARNDGGAGPQNLQLAIRTNATNYFSATKTLGVGFSANVNIWETNPNTAAAWTSSDIAALQIGVKSIA